jgi:hypothetical protein
MRVKSPPAFPVAADDLIEPLRRERGYELPLHHVLGRLGAELLDGYAALYRHAAFTSRLSVVEREAVWLALLARDDGESPGHHARRAIEGGMDPNAVKALREGFSDPKSALHQDGRHLHPQLVGRPYALAALAVAASLKDLERYAHWLDQCRVAGMDGPYTAEALLPLLLDSGAGTFAWACARWQALGEGR